ncbi:MAG: glutamate racemase [Anaerolineae bacterium]|nr:glutamate racemase [Anaerolineae bacterium]NIN96519.1 glutamate racemase [Anaerolineae bacterium]NIQ79548.1 glutamate racemase [Anaerolineae bacterium]
MSKNAGAIGVFDSGVGGLSVVQQIVKELPREDVLFFADTFHCPYGRRSHSEIQSLAREIVAFLLSAGAKVIVVACNTASAAALHYLREIFEVPIVGMEPAVKPAAERTGSKVVGVMATEATFQGALFASLVERFASDVEVLTQTCPGLVERVEAGFVQDAETMEMLQRYLQPMMNQGIDSLVLGCTHYPHLRSLIEKITGDELEIIDPSPAVARQTARVLKREGLLREGKGGRCAFCTSGNPQLFARLLGELTDLDGPVFEVTWEEGGTIARSW